MGRNWGYRLSAVRVSFLAAFVTGLALMFRGPALSPDSAIYMSVAESVATGHGFVQFDGMPYVRWAPLYPTVLALFLRVGYELRQAVVLLQLAGHFVLTLACFLWVLQFSVNEHGKYRTLLLLAGGTILVECSTFIWSETLYLALTAVAIVALSRWSAAESDEPWTLWTAIFYTALAALTRYSGIALIAAGAWVVYRRTKRPLPTLGFVVASGAPLAAWLVRNTIIAGAPFGERVAGGFSILDIAKQIAHAASLWILPESVPVTVRAVAVGLALAVWVFVVLGVWRESRDEVWRSAAAPWIAYAIAYSILLVSWTTVSAVERIDERYLAPLFPPLVVLSVWSLGGLTPKPQRIAQVVLSVFTVFTLVRTGYRIYGYEQHGAWGFNNEQWDASATIAGLRDAPLSGRIYSNAPDALYALTGLRAALSPRAHPYNAPKQATHDLAHYKEVVTAEPKTSLVWFDDVHRGFLLPPDSLAQVTRLDVERRFKDGTVYRIAR